MMFKLKSFVTFFNSLVVQLGTGDLEGFSLPIFLQFLSVLHLLSLCLIKEALSINAHTHTKRCDALQRIFQHYNFTELTFKMNDSSEVLVTKVVCGSKHKQR